MPETFVMLAFCVLDAIFIIGAVFFGWRPFSKVLSRIWTRALQFVAVFLLTALGLTIIIPWVDFILYERGIALDDDFMIFFAPALVLILSLAAAFAVVWRL